jgi:hypothetical protein
MLCIFVSMQEREPRLPSLLKLLLWAQCQLDKLAVYPRMNDLVTGTLSDPTSEGMQVYSVVIVTPFVIGCLSHAYHV